MDAQAGKEIQQAREQGHSEGFAEGLARVQQQMTEHLAALNERRARVLAEASARVTDLACAIVARIAPDFAARSVVLPLVMQADRKSTRLNSSHYCATRMPSSDRKTNNN